MQSQPDQQQQHQNEELAKAGMCADCAQGHVWTGEPTGTESRLGALDVYIATPPASASPASAPKGAVLFIHDAFGWKLPNSRLLCDKLASLTGFTVFMPDFYTGDSLGPTTSVEHLFEDKPTMFGRFVQGVQFMAFLPTMLTFINRHGPAETLPLLQSALTDIHAAVPGAKIGAVGYCWGGKYALRLGAMGLVTASIAAHPSVVDVATDVRGTTAATLLLLAESDFAFGDKLKAEALKAIAAAGVPSEAVAYKGTKHGFAVRGSELDENVRVGRDAATKKTAEWFVQHLC
ncbi:dienelactone hydrolase [Entophlyctis helioformis]|nr:dienelactone hydrolase [Entophlyctis helioformis]